ncbi:Clavaminate synthase-like protein [Durotheca rogersii]|uniref:Clavaminate synthase-like protein n=1 Tax=Durotheca rogersii TaxID=419775 RepID=UPI00221F6CFA|nr:Clavaminate synthase-like protein [Durotheca rogersii]KAI5868584.1 Clavaminate synthase-like protein [Durotheca rogersii]
MASSSPPSSLSPADQLLELCADATTSIQSECLSVLSGSESPSTEHSLAGCGLALVDLLSRQAAQISVFYRDLRSANLAAAKTTPETRSLISKRLEDILSITYSRFYAYLFRDLPTCWRQLYTDASILKFCFNVVGSPYIYGGHLTSRGAADSERPHGDGCELGELVKVLDFALILAGAAGKQRGRSWINGALDLLHAVWADSTPPESVPDIGQTRERSRPGQAPDSWPSDVGIEAGDTFSADEPFGPPVRFPIKRVDALSMESFQAYIDNPRDTKLGPEPLIIRGSMENWPALTTNPWCRPSYLLSQTFGGRRLVPIEVGRSYVDEGWGQKIVTFGEFLREYIDPSLSRLQKESNHDGDSASPSQTKPIAYLAQHPLFTQLPALRKDILIPDYCYTAPPPHPTDPSIDQPELDEPLLNAWFGPPGTITPLHNDPYHNILTQVVGRKYVRLYSPLNTERMQARGKENGVEMGNTSLLDVGVVEGWDMVGGGDEEGQPSREDTAAFRAVPFLDCILEPGEALYIPIGWWHYVRGLSVSFSVSFWWN